MELTSASLRAVRWAVRCALVACGALLAVPLAVAQEGERQGVLLLDVAADGPAAKAGLSRGAILLEVAGVTVDDTVELVEVLEQHAREAVQIRYRFGSEERTVRVRLGDGEEVPLLGVVPEAPAPMPGLFGGPRFDLDLQPFLREAQGALIVEVREDSPAERAGLTVGDVITAVDGEPVGVGDIRRRGRGDGRGRDFEPQPSLGELIEAYDPGDRVELAISRDEEVLTLSATLAARPDGRAGAYLGVQYRPANATILRFDSSEGLPQDEEGLRRQLEERWRDWLRGGPGRFTGRQLLPI